MAQEIINVGTLPNDGTGDPLRVAYEKINENFDQLFAAASSYVSKIIAGSGVTISPTTGIGNVTINLFQSLEVDGEGAEPINPAQLIVDGGYA
jgi:hypothetical protein